MNSSNGNLPPPLSTPRGSTWALPSNVLPTPSSSNYLADCHGAYPMTDPNSLYSHPFSSSAMYHYGPPAGTTNAQTPSPSLSYSYNNSANNLNGNHPYYMKPDSMSSQSHFYSTTPAPILAHSDYSPPDRSSPEQHM